MISAVVTRCTVNSDTGTLCPPPSAGADPSRVMKRLNAK